MSIQEKALLVQLSTHAWTGKKKDKQIGRDVCTRQNADADVVEAIIRLAPPGVLKPIDVARGRVYRKHIELTLPYLDNGLRILPSAMYMEYRDKMKEAIKPHTRAVNELDTVWPEILKNKAKRLGGLANKYRLPTVEEIKRRFYIKQDIMPIPTNADFSLFDISDEEITEIENKAKESMKNAMSETVKEVWRRLADLVVNIASTMDEKDKKFHDSLIKKLKDFCATIPAYNVTDDPNLENVRKEVLTKLANLDPEDLREIPNNRKKAAKDAKDVLDRIKDYMK